MHRRNLLVVVSLIASSCVVFSSCKPIATTSASNVTSTSTPVSTAASASPTSSVASTSVASASTSVLTSPAKDTTIDHISIVESSFNSKIVLNATVNYDAIQITAYNKAGDVLGDPVSIGKNKTSFTYAAIDTSKAVEDAVFTLTFTFSGKSYTATIHYSVQATYNKTITAAKIVQASVSSKYYLGDTVDYSTIQINLLNSDGFVLSTIAATDAAITHSTIDLTSETGKTGTFDFTITYTSGTLTLSDKVSYTVYTSEQKATPTGWVASPAYSSYLNSRNSTSAVKDGTTSSFMEKSAFHLGNYNAVNLMPVISAADSQGNPTTYTRLYDTTVTLTDGNDNPLILSDYFETTDIEKLSTTGDVNFKNTVTGDFKLIYSYSGSADKTKFPDITYAMSVVSGYNINTASDLFVLNNATSDKEESSINGKLDLTAYREAHSFPKDDNGNYLTFANGVFQADITITKDNLPSVYLWSKADGCIDDVVGTYKDGSYLVHFVPSDANKTLNVYGNYHKLTIGDDIPKIVTPVGDTGGQAKASGTAHVDSHAAIFSDFIWKGEVSSLGDNYNENVGMTVQDLFAVGNQGITDSDLSYQGGLIFMKNFFGKSTIENCITNKFFLSAINGPTDFSIANNAVVSFNPHLNVINSRASDTYSCSFFNYDVGTITITGSELRNAGGPLIFNQGHGYTATDVSGGLTQDKWEPANVIVDADTVLENKVSGTGGWFAIYGVETALATLMNLNSLFQAKSKTFVTVDNSVNKMNLLALNMVESASASATAAAMCGGTTIGVEPIVAYQNGKSTLEAGIANAASDSGAAYQQALYTTDYGLNYMLKNGGTTTFFKTMKDATTANFAAVYATDATNLSTYSLVNPKTFLTKQATDGVVSTDFYKKGYMAIYTMGSDLGGDASDPTKYSAYLGSNAYGVVTTLDDYSA